MHKVCHAIFATCRGHKLELLNSYIFACGPCLYPGHFAQTLPTSSMLKPVCMFYATISPVTNIPSYKGIVYGQIHSNIIDANYCTWSTLSNISCSALCSSLKYILKQLHEQGDLEGAQKQPSKGNEVFCKERFQWETHWIPCAQIL